MILTLTVTLLSGAFATGCYVRRYLRPAGA